MSAVEPAFLSLPAAAKRMGLSHATVWRMVVAGDIPDGFILRSGKRRPRTYIAIAFIDRQSPVPA